MINRVILFFFLSIVILPLGLRAQIKINEIVSSNSSILDEDGDSPDWIELRNFGTQEVSLDQWSLTDDKNNIQKWIINQKSLEADSYAFFWASGKNRIGNGIPRTLITEGDLFKYLVPSQALPINWNEIDYNDGSWAQGISGFGYADDDDATTLPLGTASIFVRKKFNIADLNAISGLFLDIDYDDGFVAYINGQEIARANINGAPPAYNSGTITDREATIYLGGKPERFPVTNLENILQDGENVLSIQLHNISANSSDLTLIPFLTAIYNTETTEGITPPDILEFVTNEAHTNFKISSEGETVYLYDNEGLFVDSLAIGALNRDISIGLSLDGSKKVYFEETTPMEANSTTSFIGIIQDNIIFSHPGGPTGDINLELSGNQNEETVRYTIDANIPTAISSNYDTPISLNETTIIRARIFREGYIASPVQSRSYLFNANSDLPIVSIVTEPRNFFDSDYGIYVLGDDYNGDFPYFGSNIWEDWERPVQFNLYDQNGALEYYFDGGAKIFGGWSRANAQRSLSLFARNKYGFSAIDHKIFPNHSLESYQSIVLRNAGNDWNNSHLRDKVLTSLMDGSGVDHQQVRTVSSYINGYYWGIYNIREKVNEHFIADNHQIDPDLIDILEFDAQIVYGDNMDYQLMVNYLNSNNLTNDANFQIIEEQVDIVNFASYFAAQIYYNNTDWPGNNIKFWRQKNGKWKWILYDTDFGFGTWNPFDYQNNTLAFATDPFGPNWPNPPWSTLLFRKLLQNTTFKHIFINRYADYMNSRFLDDVVVEKIDAAADEITAEMIDQMERWDGNINSWNLQIQNLKNFASVRQVYAKNHIIQEFDLPGKHVTTIQNNTVERGFVQLNSLTIANSTWSGDYFETVPIELTAIARPGFQFSHWEGATNSTDENITFLMEADETFIPVFELSTSIPQTLVINEINYNSSENWDSGDWIELHNPNDYILNISNWNIKDANDNSYTFPSNTVIYPEGYLVIVRDLPDFQFIYPNVENIVGEFDFGLGETDEIRLFNQFNILQDSVSYSSASPWPEEPNGTGATLELISPELDNLLAENWKVLHINGSAGESNKETTSILEDEDPEYTIQVYPNPTSFSVSFTLPTDFGELESIIVTDINGLEILVHNQRSFLKSMKQEIDLSTLSSGIYFLQFKSKEKLSASSKVIKI